MKGTSVTISVVLLIALAVVTTIGIYFFSIQFTQPIQVNPQGNLVDLAAVLNDVDEGIIKITNDDSLDSGTLSDIPTTNGICHILESLTPFIEDDFETYAIGSNGAANWVSGLGVVNVSSFGSGQAFNITSGTPDGYTTHSTALPSAYSIQATVFVNTTGTNSPHPGVMIAYQDADNYDAMYIRPLNDDILHFRVRGGAVTAPEIASVTIDLDTTYKLRAVVSSEGDATVFLDGVELGTIELVSSRLNGGFWWQRGVESIGYLDNFTVREITSIDTLSPGHSVYCQFGNLPSGEVTLFPPKAKPFTLIFP